ncbi:ParB/RepB/Spo0J family partition protein [Corynebacterium diphtheriae bv. mitis]|uniref:Cell division protein n=2 Tax=Corynebacterium diphtheriae TaxID=1717 RepID=A0A0D6HAT8_CORDP|nr:ParB/RepB/Spo0J family partition protein [Corynebacterium diphtheriae]ERA61128.1 chromosome partitioning protein ParB [Corynebacterium diphtheriae DSM 43988]OWN06968.1 cell division protein [Corynebacterium belfantii]AEX68532.1 chromosome partitioning protein B [Corynebacterium diphtheriae C7 (beta)]AEX79988.1 chromosome partitioning protein B [Corynebacterium diphtheriae HC03]EIK55237.1 chromosome partitioning protein ParB [Corynebacterium diphtheriae bv. intermedius str. NCTC 5011]
MAQETRKGGLGRGLAALITSSPSAGSRIGDTAADVVFGGPSTTPPKPGEKKKPEAPKPAAKRHRSGGNINPILADVVESHEREESAVRERRSQEQLEEFGATYREIPVGMLVPNEKNPRSVFDEDDLSELVHSIKEFGLLQPIVVRRVKESPDERYEIIMGERRWRASSKAGLPTIPAIVRQTDDSDMLRDALLENIHRVQLNPLEEAAAYQQLLEEFGVTQNELADRLGRSRPVITNMIRLLGLPVDVQRKVAAGVLSAGHARALLGVKAGEDTQAELAQRIIAEGLSVRATEEAVTLLNRGEKPAPKKREKTPTPEFLTHAADRLADDLDTKVSVSMGKRKGKIVVEFGGREDFERIMGLLGGEH